MFIWSSILLPLTLMLLTLFMSSSLTRLHLVIVDALDKLMAFFTTQMVRILLAQLKEPVGRQLPANS